MTYQKKNLFEETFKQFPDGIIFTFRTIYINFEIFHSLNNFC
jgi:hypothetical protein